MKNKEKYQPYQGISLTDRQWPGNRLEKAPHWCSVDLRDGNQALETPMNLDQKLRFFQKLTEMGFKTIEIGFPAASDTEYAFTRYLIEHDLIPDDVAIQVLTQSRPHIISQTFAAVQGCKKAVIHLYNSTSVLQRDVVFSMNQDQCVDLAVSGARQIKTLSEQDIFGTEFIFEYSPESFTGTEMDFAVRICDAVCDVWQPTPERKVIINLPATVEMSTPNIYADQIEYFCSNTRHRPSIMVSLHTHNDRGTAVAATELGLLAGAERVEGTLFGNGERTGNADLVALALNLFSQGVDPELDLTDINSLIEIYEETTRMEVPPRHPYAGKLVYTAFSGSHQDAINKGLAAFRKKKGPWSVPYLPIDPLDVGRSYEPIIRINSQSGKGGIAYILEQNYGLLLPKPVQQAFSQIVTASSDRQQRELKADEIYQLFQDTYVNLMQPLKLVTYKEEMISDQLHRFEATLEHDGREVRVEGQGNGLLDAFCQALRQYLNSRIEITLYQEHALERGSTSKAITYVQIQNGGERLYIGAGVSSSISRSSLRAVVSAVNQMLRTQTA
ncbi:MAG: 2-isopropylmalate synthase [Ruminococcaceae bacterium]|nr:2-isopropylmalate synthase [Oscillospiraceae bacterium]